MPSRPIWRRRGDLDRFLDLLPDGAQQLVVMRARRVEYGRVHEVAQLLDLVRLNLLFSRKLRPEVQGCRCCRRRSRIWDREIRQGKDDQATIDVG